MSPQALLAAQPQTLEDHWLIKRYLNNQDQACFEVLYERYANKIYAKCLSLLQDTAQAEDAAQEIFVKIFLKLADFNHQSKFSTWVYSVTYNYCIDQLRRQRKQQLNQQEPHWDLADETGGLELELEHFEEELQRVRRILAELPEEEKNLLIMKYEAGLSIKDLAKHYKINESAIKMRLKRAKDKVRLRYDQLYFFNILLWLEII